MLCFIQDVKKRGYYRTMNGIFDSLNEKQAEAVRTTEGYVRVIAGAGSGKTKLLVSRYAYLVKDYGIDSADILCVTFTNKAAGEMKRRIRALIGPEYDTSLICTYHGFCARLLREEREKLFLDKNFDIIDSTRQKTLLEDIYQKHELKLDHASFESILKKIGIFKSDISYVPRMCSPSKMQIMPSIGTLDDLIIEEFLQKQKSIYALDFDDLMSFALYLLKNNSEVRSKWQNKLSYIQVDEFQDSDKCEMELVDILSRQYQNLMIVGDPDQNIYEWRGSDVMLLVDFDKVYSPSTTIFLTRNYRSTPQILSCANSLIDKNEFRLKKDLYTMSPKGADVIHYHSRSDTEEMNRITDIIRDIRRERGLGYSDFAVLYRSGFLSRTVEKKFVESGIPYEIFGGVKFYNRMEVQDVIAYLRLIAYDDDMSFKRIVNTPRRRFGRTKLASLVSMQESMSGGESLFSLLRANIAVNPFKQSDAEGFIKFIEAMRELSKSARISEIVQKVCEDSGYENYIRSLGDEERLENLAEFKRIADEFERSYGENLTLGEFLQQIALQSSEDEEKGKDSVKLMTIHASKGLEFPVVFIIGFSEGIFPSSKTIEQRKKAGLEEERRLCYVAITRARERLFLMDSEGFSQNGIKKLPSRFLFEIGAGNYVRVGEISKELEEESRAYISKTMTPFEYKAKEQALEVGESVEHHAFGCGTIVAFDEKRGCYTVRFDRLPQPRNISADYFAKNHANEEYIPLSAAEKLSDTDAALPPSDSIKSLASGTAKSSPKENSKVEQKQEKEEQEREQEAPLSLSTLTADTPVAEIPAAETPAAEMPAADKSFSKESESQSFVAELYEEPGSDLNDKDVFEEGEVIGTPSKETKISEELRKKLAETDNLWKREDVPHSGWSCIGITDLGEPVGVCEMCGYQIIRYVHNMIHPLYPKTLGVGCVCAGKMEENPERARKRERDYKNRHARYENFKKRKWKTSAKGNSYLKIRNHVIVLFSARGDGWSFSIDSEFSKVSYSTKDDAINAAFLALCKLEGVN